MEELESNQLDLTEESVSRYTQKKLQRMMADVITNHFPISDVLLLLKYGCDPNGSVTKGLRPLHYAAYEDNVAYIKILLEHGALVDSCDDVGYTPLHIAAKYGHEGVVRVLLEHDAVVNFVEGQEGGEEASKILASLTEHPLSLAAENDHPECLELLLLYGADPNRKTFLGYEINLIPLENTQCLEMMLKYGADPDAVSRGGLTPLMKAAKLNQLEAAQVLITYGANVNLQCPPRFDCRRAIHFACITGKEDMLRLLLSAGALTSRPPDYAYTPLYYAIVHDQPNICRILLEHGADPDELNDDGCSPLQVVCSNTLQHQKNITEQLLSAGAEPNCSRQFFSYVGPSLAPLVEYLTYSEDYDEELIRLFLQYGSHVNMRTPTRLLKIKDPCGMLGQVRKLQPHNGIFYLLLDAARYFDAEAISRDITMSSNHRSTLLDAALTPRSLKQLTRVAVRHFMRKPVPKYVKCIPLPPYLRDYIQFNTF